MYIYGNSFSAYDERLLLHDDRQRSLVIRALPLVREIHISLGNVDQQFAFAFSDSSLHNFEVSYSTSNVLDLAGEEWVDEETIENGSFNKRNT